ncbi:MULTISPECIES: 50S ribosomal protein L21e [Haloferax]|uniref:Large ribosomal subunit protein eL21 n=2 Tax=Haloferax gibbonsii TaxID=35746 RepID=A0A0K1IWB7_HALGI|nr:MULTISPECIES: 50S ribosomal protein L21e [Haloferax]AKU08751.1 50S ribosomal protein L21 [Haloferax gibbonsii]ELZ81112.1 50S ribosomal protein L21e [Haloferax gibbonsii ATCC 33959]MCO8268179.1 50S ribosomal protein L21e [Haloferax sp. AB510]QOS12073.1 50S ribosomal protein L21e [Haloferax gibbonsii]RDZ52109.1 50S ribosomal protein L21e [Haloferax sp. Atlit-4N]
MPSSNGPMKGTRGKLSNKPRERGTSPPQRAIAEFEEGQKVHLNIDPSVREGRFHPRFNGLTGEVLGKQGRAFKVQINDGGKEKTVIVRPAHLRAQQ